MDTKQPSQPSLSYLFCSTDAPRPQPSESNFLPSRHSDADAVSGNRRPLPIAFGMSKIYVQVL